MEERNTANHIFICSKNYQKKVILFLANVKTRFNHVQTVAVILIYKHLITVFIFRIYLFTCSFLSTTCKGQHHAKPINTGNKFYSSLSVSC